MRTANLQIAYGFFLLELMNERELCLTHVNYWCRTKPPNCTDNGWEMDLIELDTYRTHWKVWVPKCHFVTSCWGMDLAQRISETIHVEIERLDHCHQDLKPAITTAQTRYYVLREYLRRHTDLRYWIRHRERCPVCNRAYHHHVDIEYRAGFERWYGSDPKTHYCRSSREEKKCPGPSLFELREIRRIIKERKIKWLIYHQDMLVRIQRALRSENPPEALRLLRKEYTRRSTSLR